MAVFEKLFGRELVHDLQAVKAVHHDHVGGFAEYFHVLGAIGLHDLEEVALFRQLEKRPRHGDDLRVDVYRHAHRVGQVFIYPAGKRATTQADLQDVRRVVAP